ncbi:PC4 domain-containing protein [Nephila pilipes]|uniref:PC4 domain-containing protein n=1 Tax=Nephila pilipes TaxID=299642 RepID=A0A8X6TTH6_NEPPI|nr:PC4 domain-containing protein [Nephila pilipes]
MKRVVLLASNNALVKKVCFNKDSKKDSSFKQDSDTENHFHLSRSICAIVSDFVDVAQIHLRQYKLDANGSLLLTKHGITLILSVWLALVRKFATIDQAFHDGKVFVVKVCLTLSRTVIENVTYIILQCYYQRKDFFLANFWLLFPC